MSNSDHASDETPLLEWIAAGVGLLLLIALVAIISRAAIARQRSQPPSIEVTAGNPSATASGFVLPLKAVNSSSDTAAAVQIAGTLRQGGRIIEESRATIDYVPGDGRASGGLFFQNDPRRYELTVRAVGYEDP